MTLGAKLFVGWGIHLNLSFFFVVKYILVCRLVYFFFRGLLIHLLVREVLNRLQRYGKVFKLPKNYVIIFENQAKLMAWICWAVLKNVMQMLSKQLDYLSYFIDYQLIVFFDKSLTKRWFREVSFCTTDFSPFFGSSDRWSDAFAPAGRDSSLHCPQGVALGYALLPLLGVK